jgi:glycosyltransferase involved in cell wall biosynthesis
MINPTSLQKPRLVVVTSTYPRWENDTWPGFVHELCARLASGYDITVVTPRMPGSAELECRDNVRIRRFAYLPGNFEGLSGDDGIFQTLRKKPWLVMLLPFFFVAMILAIRHEVKKGASAIHAHWFPWGFLATLAAPKTPVLVTAHGSDVFKLRNGFWRWLRRTTSRRASAITVVSKRLCDRLLEEGLPAEKIVLAPMGVDLKKQFIPAASDVDKTIDVIFVGRLIDAKGPDLLINAMPSVYQAYPETRLVFVGDGPLMESLMSSAKHFGMQEKIKFMGARPNQEIASLLRKARVCVMPGRAAADGTSEGLGLVAIEALGCGCRLISGPNPALQGMLPSGAPVEFIHPENSSELSAAMINALNQESAALSFHHELAKQFDWERVSENYARILGMIRD